MEVKGLFLNNEMLIKLTKCQMSILKQGTAKIKSSHKNIPQFMFSVFCLALYGYYAILSWSIKTTIYEYKSITYKIWTYKK